MVARIDRRELLRGAGVTIAGLSGCAGNVPDVFGGGSGSGSGPGGDEGWGQFRHDQHNTGIGTAGPTEGFERAWQWRFEPSDRAEDGFFGHSCSAPVGTPDTAFVSCYLQYRTKEGELTRRGLLAAVDVEAGETKWTIDTGQPLDQSAIFAPVVHEGTVVAAEPEGLVAVDVETGEEKWTEGIDTPIGAPLTAFDGTLYVGSDVLRAISIDDGGEEWHFEGTGKMNLYPNFHPPAVTEETIYVPFGADLIAVDRKDGTRQWRETVGKKDPIYGGRERVYPPVVSDGSLYVGTGNFLARGTGHVSALDPETGDEEWSFIPEASEKREELRKIANETGKQLPIPQLGVYGSPVVSGDAVYVTGVQARERRLFALDAASGEVREEESVDGIAFHPLMAGETLYLVSTETVQTVATNELDVEEEEPLSTSPKHLRSPALIGGRVVVPTLRGLEAYGE